MKFGWMAAFGLTVALALTGCATTIGKDYDQGKVSQFMPGQTTMDQVIAALGQPQERETESDGSVRLHYQYVVAKGSVSDYVPFSPKSANTDGKDSYHAEVPKVKPGLGRRVGRRYNSVHISPCP